MIGMFFLGAGFGLVHVIYIVCFERKRNDLLLRRGYDRAVDDILIFGQYFDTEDDCYRYGRFVDETLEENERRLSRG